MKEEEVVDYFIRAVNLLPMFDEDERSVIFEEVNRYIKEKYSTLSDCQKEEERLNMIREFESLKRCLERREEESAIEAFFGIDLGEKTFEDLIDHSLALLKDVVERLESEEDHKVMKGLALVCAKMFAEDDLS